MATNQTANYELNQWLSTDQVVRTDFNADNAKMDAVLAGLAENLEEKADQTALMTFASAVPQIAAGTYTGDGEASQIINLGFTPKAVLSCTQEGLTYSSSNAGFVYGGLAVTGAPACNHYQHTSSSLYVDYPGVEIVSGGFKVYETAFSDSSSVHCNKDGETYHYLAIG